MSTPAVSTLSDAVGRNHSARTPTRTDASKRSGLRWNSPAEPRARLHRCGRFLTHQRMTTRGKIILTLLILVVVGYGASRWWEKLRPGSHGGAASPGEERPAAELVETQFEVPSLAAPAAYQPKNGVVEIELSEYAGYAGLIVANGGLDPNETSPFFKNAGFKLKITLSEEESWSALNSGKMAASATTVDVLAVYGKQFQVVVPAQIGFSRGADGVVVRPEIKRIN